MKREAYFLKVLKGGLLCQFVLDPLKMMEKFLLESTEFKVKGKICLYSGLRFVPY